MRGFHTLFSFFRRRHHRDVVFVVGVVVDVVVAVAGVIIALKLAKEGEGPNEQLLRVVRIDTVPSLMSEALDQANGNRSPAHTYPISD